MGVGTPKIGVGTPELLLIGQITSADHWPTDLSCSLAKLPQLIIGLLTSASIDHFDLFFSLLGGGVKNKKINGFQSYV